MCLWVAELSFNQMGVWSDTDKIRSDLPDPPKEKKLGVEITQQSSVTLLLCPSNDLPLDLILIQLQQHNTDI